MGLAYEDARDVVEDVDDFARCLSLGGCVFS